MFDFFAESRLPACSLTGTSTTSWGPCCWIAAAKSQVSLTAHVYFIRWLELAKALEGIIAAQNSNGQTNTTSRLWTCPNSSSRTHANLRPSSRYMPVARRYTQRYPAAPLDCTLDQHLTRAKMPFAAFKARLDGTTPWTIFFSLLFFFLSWDINVAPCRGMTTVEKNKKIKNGGRERPREMLVQLEVINTTSSV